MKSEEHNITINDKKVLYWQKNPEKKEIVILLHGFPGNHLGLVDLAHYLDNEYRIIIPDFPACGASEILDQKHILENYAKWLDDFMQHLSIDRAIIAGHSFGSRVALSFSINYPKRTEKMILMTPVLKVDGLAAYCIALHCNIAKILPDYMRKMWLSNGFYHKVSHMIIFKSSDEDKKLQIMEWDFQEAKKMDHRVVMEIFDEFYKSNLITLSHQIRAESLIIAGDSDEIVNLNSIEKLSSNLIGSYVKIMENSGHLVPLEEPAATANIINSWLSEPLPIRPADQRKSLMSGFMP